MVPQGAGTRGARTDASRDFAPDEAGDYSRTRHVSDGS